MRYGALSFHLHISEAYIRSESTACATFIMPSHFKCLFLTRRNMIFIHRMRRNRERDGTRICIESIVVRLRRALSRLLCVVRVIRMEYCSSHAWHVYLCGLRTRDKKDKCSYLQHSVHTIYNEPIRWQSAFIHCCVVVLTMKEINGALTMLMDRPNAHCP